MIYAFYSNNIYILKKNIFFSSLHFNKKKTEINISFQLNVKLFFNIENVNVCCFVNIKI